MDGRAFGRLEVAGGDRGGERDGGVGEGQLAEIGTLRRGACGKGQEERQEFHTSVIYYMRGVERHIYVGIWMPRIFSVRSSWARKNSVIHRRNTFFSRFSSWMIGYW